MCTAVRENRPRETQQLPVGHVYASQLYHLEVKPLPSGPRGGSGMVVVFLSRTHDTAGRPQREKPYCHEFPCYLLTLLGPVYTDERKQATRAALLTVS